MNDSLFTLTSLPFCEPVAATDAVVEGGQL
jgi:hypothetical protein